MNITKDQWGKWASDYAAQSADDFAGNVPLTIVQHVILKAKIEQAALYGIELCATMVKMGANINDAADMKAALMSPKIGGDNTYKMKLTHDDSGKPLLIHETEKPDGEN